MPVTKVQRGNIGQTEAAKVLMITSNGEVECDTPASDDEHRDAEVHRRRHFAAIALQIKTAWRLWVHRQSQILQIPFTVHVGQLVSDPRFYYLFAFFDMKTMTFRDPLFLVPSDVVHNHAQPRRVGNRWHFEFQASLKDGARDQFSAYRVSRDQLGKVLLKIIEHFEQQARAGRLSTASLENLADVVWIRPRRSRQSKRKAA